MGENPEVFFDWANGGIANSAKRGVKAEFATDQRELSNANSALTTLLMAPAGPYSDSLMDAPNGTAPRSGCNSFFKVAPNITRIFVILIKVFFGSQRRKDAVLNHYVIFWKHCREVHPDSRNRKRLDWNAIVQWRGHLECPRHF